MSNNLDPRQDRRFKHLQPQTFGAGESGARFFLIATQGCNLIAQILGTLEIPTGERHGQGEFQLLELVISLTRSGGEPESPAGWSRRSGTLRAPACRAMLEAGSGWGGVCHGHFLPILTLLTSPCRQAAVANVSSWAP